MKSKSGRSRLVPLILLIISIAAIIFIPLKIISYGYLPQDDALRHAAKVISGKSWDEILVLGSAMPEDINPGWNRVLEIVHTLMRSSTDGLVVFSVVSLFALFSLVGLLFLKRQEAWLLSLLVITIANPLVIMRLFLGRPYLVTMSVFLIICFIWRRFRQKRVPLVPALLVAFSVSAAVWIHGLWNPFILIFLPFFIAEEWRAGLLIGACSIAGILVGACLTGHPYQFLALKNAADYIFHNVGLTYARQMLVTEMQPFNGDPMVVFAAIGLLAWQTARRGWDPKRVYNPVFVLAFGAWLFGFVVQRSWLDWGVPAVAVWMALQFESMLRVTGGFFSWRRLVTASLIAVTFFLAITANYEGRWTKNLTTQYLSAENPVHRPWLPEPGGIIYNADMSVFYQTFYKNPRGPWRYILGPEPTVMPAEDLETLKRIRISSSAYTSYDPWVKKMKYEDRLIIKNISGVAPPIPELEWANLTPELWVGRLPRKPR